MKENHGASLENAFDDKVVGISGGTGSFGRTMVNFLLENTSAEVKVFSRDERKQDHMRRSLNNPRVNFIVGDVRDVSSVSRLCSGTDFIFHAAALKQVPSCEFFPMEAVKTNVLGTENVLSQAESAGVKSVVCLSTDKAVYPINAMGISKAMMEKVARSMSRDFKNTKVCVTRYGNVMGSRGSVIPIFCDQISKGLPVTITDGDMTRFLMDLNQSVELVLKAFLEGNNGDLYVQKAPACTIMDLANAVGSYYNSKVDVRTIGVRHGEKKYETLLGKEEFAASEDIGEFYRVPADTRDLNYDQYYIVGDREKKLGQEYNSDNTNRFHGEDLNKLIASVIEKGFHD